MSPAILAIGAALLVVGLGLAAWRGWERESAALLAVVILVATVTAALLARGGL